MNNVDFMESKPHYWTWSKRARPLKPNCVGFKPGKRRWQLLKLQAKGEITVIWGDGEIKEPPPLCPPPHQSRITSTGHFRGR